MKSYNHVRSNTLQLYKAALTDDWEAAERIFDQDPDADVTALTSRSSTTLHIAVGSNCSHRFVDKLINRIAEKDITKLRAVDCVKNNSLHYAAKSGNTKAAMALVKKDPQMTMIGNEDGDSAVMLAAWYGRKETLEYLMSVTPNNIGDGEDGMISPYSGVAGGNLITLAIIARFYDVALCLIKKYPNLATVKNRNGFTALQTLATQPDAFPSGLRWWLWQHIIYYCIPLNSTEMSSFDIHNLKSEERRKKKTHCFIPECFIYVPLLKTIHDKKLEHKRTNQLMKGLVATVINVGEIVVEGNVLGTAICTAAQHGIHELVEECMFHYPGLLGYMFDGLDFLMIAIKFRQVKVYNLVYQMTAHWAHGLQVTTGADTALHLVGRMAFPHRLNDVTGAALQMQRELQWFKEVETFVLPTYLDARNSENRTPRMVFTEEHKELVEQGEKWMKDTAASSTVVAALIVTVAFAAIFTVPGGNKEDGTPYYLHDSTFFIFAISDAVALFSSVTSVLMFLAMLTSRYSEGDFLYALPKRITIGLLGLFISIAAIMVTFCAALALVLREELSWIAIPVGLTACVPVTFFALLQFPLLVELVFSTYGPSIFHKQGNLLLH